MNITFFGAAQTVTGSCYILETAGCRFAVDCGMHQGNPEIEKRNFDTGGYNAQGLDFILLTHAHIDHSGLLPRMVAEGFKGPIYCTRQTADLAALMLEDSAHIQESEWEIRANSSHRKGKQESEPLLYSMDDAKQAARQMQSRDFGAQFIPHPNVKVIFRRAGHILGAAFIEIEITEGGKTTRLTFSGDIGRPRALLAPEAEKPAPTDWLFVESTYGDRDHKGEDDTLKELAGAIAHSYAAREKVIIPTFAVERAQEVLYSLILLHNQGGIPEDIPIYLDSPLAIRATEVFLKYANQMKTIDGMDLNVINDRRYNIHSTLSIKDSQALNTQEGPAIILSASGMINAGRVKHHIKHNIWRSGASIVIVGYQAVGTLGRKLVDGASTVRVFGEQLAVKAKVFLINGFSAHAGQNQLLDWIEPAARPGLNLVITHGELKKQSIFAEAIKQKWGLKALIPALLEDIAIEPGTGTVELLPTPESARPRKVNWKPVQQELETRMAQLRELLDNMDSLPWETQTELRSRLLEINSDLLTLLSDVA